MQNSFIDWIVEHTLAGYLSRSCGKYSALIAVVIGGIGATLVAAAQSNTLPHQYALSVGGVGGLLVAIAGLMGHQNSAASSQSQTLGIGSKASALLLCAMLLSCPLHAQTSSSSSTSTAAVAASLVPASATVSSSACSGLCFAAASGAAAVHYKGTWSVANITREYFDLIDFGKTKSNHLDVQGIEFLAPGPGVSLYQGGFVFRPSLANLFSKTNIPPGSIGTFLDANVGTGVYASGPAHISWSAGGGVAYKLGGAVSFTPITAQYARTGSTGFAVISSELEYVFAGK